MECVTVNGKFTTMIRGIGYTVINKLENFYRGQNEGQNEGERNSIHTNMQGTVGSVFGAVGSFQVSITEYHVRQSPKTSYSQPLF